MDVLEGWFRIDKETGSVSHAENVAVTRAARAAFQRPSDAIATHRFSTPFAIYSTGGRLTQAERRQLAQFQPQLCGQCGRSLVDVGARCCVCGAESPRRTE
jgi:hypothetical protein